MRNRGSSSGEGSRKKNFGYEFYQQIKSIITDSQAILKPQKVLGLFPVADGFDVARNALGQLEAELNFLNRIVLTEENSRQQFKTTSQMLSDRSDAEAAVVNAEKNYKKLKVDLVRDKEALELEESRLSNEIRTKTLEIGAAQGSEIVSDNLTLNKLGEEKKALNRRVAKLQKKCCPSKENKQELADAEVKLEQLTTQIMSLQTDRTAEDKISSQIEKLKNELANVRKKIEAHNNDQQVLASAKQRITDARIAYEKINEREIRQEERYYARQSKKAMRSFLRNYIRFLSFKKEMDDIYIANTKADKSVILNKFIKALNAVKERVDEIIDLIWCPSFENRSARQIFDAMSEGDRQALFKDLEFDVDDSVEEKIDGANLLDSKSGLFSAGSSALRSSGTAVSVPSLRT